MTPHRAWRGREVYKLDVVKDIHVKDIPAFDQAPAAKPWWEFRLKPWRTSTQMRTNIWLEQEPMDTISATFSGESTAWRK